MPLNLPTHLSYGTYEEYHGPIACEYICTTLPIGEKYSSYQIFIAKTVRYIGTFATRPGTNVS